MLPGGFLSQYADELIEAVRPKAMSWHRNSADPSVGPPELERAGIGLPAASRMHLAVDPKRTSALGCNVMQLRLVRERLLEG